MRAFTVVAGGVVPVLVNVEASINNLVGYPVTKAIITVVSLLVVVTVSLESVFHYREQWKNTARRSNCSGTSNSNSSRELGTQGSNARKGIPVVRGAS